jgi:predicted RNA binding protein YcfA (HicA-like mRNA interferase family)
MTRLPAAKPRDVIRALERAGFVVIRTSGSHHHMVHRSRLRSSIPLQSG